MQNLIIEQRGPQGLVKTWKIRSEQGTLTFGRSKHADLRSPLDGIKGIQGVFEFRPDNKGGRWYYVNVDLNTQHPEMKPNQTELCIDKNYELRFGTTMLSFQILEVRSPLWTSLVGEVVQSGTGRHPFQLFSVYSGATLLETTLVPFDKSFSTKHDPTNTKFQPEKTEGWKKTDVGHLQISQRTVYLNDVQALKHITAKQLIDEDAKKSLTFTLAGALLLALLFIAAPKNNALDDVISPLPQTAREVKIEMPKKKSAKSTPKPEPTEQPVAAAAPKQQTQNGASKAASMIKNLASGRITQLVGKISSSAARSANVVVTSGVAAGSAPTGRALAAIGAIGKSGKDWSSEGKGTGVTISTNGKAGGQGTSGLGALATGKTGQGGVGLLEEEGEITGGLDREVISQYIKSQLGQILYCYERQLSASPDLYGKVSIKFTITGDGGVETQRISDTTLKNATVEGCILQRVAKWKFPTPEGGTKVVVTYPFLFKSTN